MKSLLCLAEQVFFRDDYELLSKLLVLAGISDKEMRKRRPAPAVDFRDLNGVRAKEVVIPSFLRAATDFLTFHGPLKSDIEFCALKFKGMH